MDVTMTKDGNMTGIDIKNVDENNFEKVWGIVNETIDKDETKEADKETVTGEEIKKAVNHGIDDYCFDYMPEKTVEELKEREMLNPNSIADGMDGKNTLEAIAKKRIDNDDEYKPYCGMVMAALIACEYTRIQSRKANATAEKEADVKDIMISGADTKLGTRSGVDDFAMQTIPGEDITEKIERETYNTMTLIGHEVNDNAKALYDIADRDIADDEMLSPYKAVMKAATIACKYMWTQSEEKEATVTGEELADMMRIGIRDFYNAWQSDAGNPQPWKADDMEKDRGFYNVAYDFISDVEEYPVYSAIKMAATIACEYMCRKAMKEDAPEIPKVSGLRDWP